MLAYLNLNFTLLLSRSGLSCCFPALTALYHYNKIVIGFGRGSMTCKLIMTLISESQKGDCGNDWAYDLEVKVFQDGLKGEGTVSVPKHILKSGEIRKPFGDPAPLELCRGDCESGLQVKMELTATEVDVFVNDVGKASKDITIECPGAGGHPVTREVDLVADVREAPRILNKSAVFTLRVRFSLTNC